MLEEVGNMKTTTEMQLVPIDQLVPYVNNARTHSPEQINKLRASLREFGFINPVIIDRDFGVIAGHGRIAAAKEEHITEVPCVFADHLTEAQKKAYILADNRMALDAGWDEEMLRIELEALQDMDFDPMLTGFDETELTELFGHADGDDVEDDDFDLTAALEKASFVQRGDIWTVGKHRLMCGDATEVNDVETLMDGKPVNHETIRSNNVFFGTFMLIFFVSAFLLSFENLDFSTVFTAVIATMSNIGPGLSLVGPAANFGFFSDLSKIVLIFDMLAGRLELFPILMLFHPKIWNELFSKRRCKELKNAGKVLK